MTAPVSVLIADDHPVFRKGLTDVLASADSFRVVAEAADGEAALRLIDEHRPRIAVVDLEMPKMSGLAVAEAVRRQALDTVIVILTMHSGAALFRRALELDVKGYVLKESAATDILACLRLVVEGQSYVSPALSQHLVERRPRTPVPELAAVAALTPAERRVLTLIARNHTTAEIARQLGVTPKTVEHHRSHICRTLGLEGPQALLRFSLEHKTLLE